MPNNVPITAMDGKENIKNCSVAFINKSKKDYMVMKKVFPCCCAVQNEGLGCFSPENVEYLKANSDSQILSFDSDVIGVQNSQQITKLFDFGYANVPRKYLKEGIKDWADLARTHGMDAIKDYLIKKGFQPKKNLDIATNDQQSALKLEAGRIDLWASGSVLGPWTAKRAKAGQLTPLLTFEKTELYAAFHKSASDEFIKKLNTTLKKMKDDGTVAKISSKYLGQ
jgi:ABC-type amino acid transport substrate-binding protein